MADDVIQHGVEVPIGDEPVKPKEPDKPAEKSDVEKLREEFRKELDARDKQIAELRESEKYWARKAGRAVEPEPDESEEPEEPQEPEEKPERLLDELSADGLKAIEKRGFVKRSDVERMVNDKVNRTLEEVQQGQAFDAKLQRDFPDLTDPKSELFKRAGANFREMVELDPKAKGSRVALYAAAKLAARELETEKKVATTNDREERRRQRIADQAPERGRTRQSNDDDEFEMSPQARQIVKNLERFGVKEEGYRRGR